MSISFMQIDIYVYIRGGLILVSRGVPIYRIGKISAANMAKFIQYRQLVFFEIVLIFLLIFYTSTNWLNALFSCHHVLLC